MRGRSRITIKTGGGGGHLYFRVEQRNETTAKG